MSFHDLVNKFLDPLVEPNESPLETLNGLHKILSENETQRSDENFTSFLRFLDVSAVRAVLEAPDESGAQTRVLALKCLAHGFDEERSSTTMQALQRALLDRSIPLLDNTPAGVEAQRIGLPLLLKCVRRMPTFPRSLRTWFEDSVTSNVIDLKDSADPARIAAAIGGLSRALAVPISTLEWIKHQKQNFTNNNSNSNLQQGSNSANPTSSQQQNPSGNSNATASSSNINQTMKIPAEVISTMQIIVDRTIEIITAICPLTASSSNNMNSSNNTTNSNNNNPNQLNNMNNATNINNSNNLNNSSTGNNIIINSANATFSERSATMILRITENIKNHPSGPAILFTFGQVLHDAFNILKIAIVDSTLDSFLGIPSSSSSSNSSSNTNTQTPSAHIVVNDLPRIAASHVLAIRLMTELDASVQIRLSLIESMSMILKKKPNYLLGWPFEYLIVGGTAAFCQQQQPLLGSNININNNNAAAGVAGGASDNTANKTNVEIVFFCPGPSVAAITGGDARLGSLLINILLDSMDLVPILRTSNQSFNLLSRLGSFISVEAILASLLSIVQCPFMEERHLVKVCDFISVLLHRLKSLPQSISQTISLYIFKVLEVFLDRLTSIKLLAEQTLGIADGWEGVVANLPVSVLGAKDIAACLPFGVSAVHRSTSGVDGGLLMSGAMTSMPSSLTEVHLRLLICKENIAVLVRTAATLAATLVHSYPAFIVSSKQNFMPDGLQFVTSPPSIAISESITNSWPYPTPSSSSSQQQQQQQQQNSNTSATASSSSTGSKGPFHLPEPVLDLTAQIIICSLSTTHLHSIAISTVLSTISIALNPQISNAGGSGTAGIISPSPSIISHGEVSSVLMDASSVPHLSRNSGIVHFAEISKTIASIVSALVVSLLPDDIAEILRRIGPFLMELARRDMQIVRNFFSIWSDKSLKEKTLKPYFEFMCTFLIQSIPFALSPSANFNSHASISFSLASYKQFNSTIPSPSSNSNHSSLNGASSQLSRMTSSGRLLHPLHAPTSFPSPISSRPSVVSRALSAFGLDNAALELGVAAADPRLFEQSPFKPRLHTSLTLSAATKQHNNNNNNNNNSYYDKYLLPELHGLHALASSLEASPLVPYSSLNTSSLLESPISISAIGIASKAARALAVFRQELLGAGIVKREDIVQAELLAEGAFFWTEVDGDAANLRSSSLMQHVAGRRGKRGVSVSKQISSSAVATSLEGEGSNDDFLMAMGELELGVDGAQFEDLMHSLSDLPPSLSLLGSLGNMMETAKNFGRVERELDEERKSCKNKDSAYADELEKKILKGDRPSIFAAALAGSLTSFACGLPDAFRGTMAESASQSQTILSFVRFAMKSSTFSLPPSSIVILASTLLLAHAGTPRSVQMRLRSMRRDVTASATNEDVARFLRVTPVKDYLSASDAAIVPRARQLLESLMHAAANSSNPLEALSIIRAFWSYVERMPPEIQSHVGNRTFDLQSITMTIPGFIELVISKLSDSPPLIRDAWLRTLFSLPIRLRPPVYVHPGLGYLTLHGLSSRDTDVCSDALAFIEVFTEDPSLGLSPSWIFGAGLNASQIGGSSEARSPIIAALVQLLHHPCADTCSPTLAISLTGAANLHALTQPSAASPSPQMMMYTSQAANSQLATAIRGRLARRALRLIGKLGHHARAALLDPQVALPRLSPRDSFPFAFAIPSFESVSVLEDKTDHKGQVISTRELAMSFSSMDAAICFASYLLESGSGSEAYLRIFPGAVLIPKSTVAAGSGASTGGLNGVSGNFMLTCDSAGVPWSCAPPGAAGGFMAWSQAASASTVWARFAPYIQAYGVNGIFNGRGALLYNPSTATGGAMHALTPSKSSGMSAIQTLRIAIWMRMSSSGPVNKNGVPKGISQLLADVANWIRLNKQQQNLSANNSKRSQVAANVRAWFVSDEPRAASGRRPTEDIQQEALMLHDMVRALCCAASASWCGEEASRAARQTLIEMGVYVGLALGCRSLLDVSVLPGSCRASELSLLTMVSALMSAMDAQPMYAGRTSSAFYTLKVLLASISCVSGENLSSSAVGLDIIHLILTFCKGASSSEKSGGILALISVLEVLPPHFIKSFSGQLTDALLDAVSTSLPGSLGGLPAPSAHFEARHNIPASKLASEAMIRLIMICSMDMNDNNYYQVDGWVTLSNLIKNNDIHNAQLLESQVKKSEYKKNNKKNEQTHLTFAELAERFSEDESNLEFAAVDGIIRSATIRLASFSPTARALSIRILNRLSKVFQCEIIELLYIPARQSDLQSLNISPHHADKCQILLDVLIELCSSQACAVFISLPSATHSPLRLATIQTTRFLLSISKSIPSSPPPLLLKLNPSDYKTPHALSDSTSSFIQQPVGLILGSCRIAIELVYNTLATNVFNQFASNISAASGFPDGAMSGSSDAGFSPLQMSSAPAVLQAAAIEIVEKAASACSLIGAAACHPLWNCSLDPLNALIGARDRVQAYTASLDNTTDSNIKDSLLLIPSVRILESGLFRCAAPVSLLTTIIAGLFSEASKVSSAADTALQLISSNLAFITSATQTVNPSFILNHLPSLPEQPTTQLAGANNEENPNAAVVESNASPSSSQQQQQHDVMIQFGALLKALGGAWLSEFRHTDLKVAPCTTLVCVNITALTRLLAAIPPSYSPYVASTSLLVRLLHQRALHHIEKSSPSHWTVMNGLPLTIRTAWMVVKVALPNDAVQVLTALLGEQATPTLKPLAHLFAASNASNSANTNQSSNNLSNSVASSLPSTTAHADGLFGVLRSSSGLPLPFHTHPLASVLVFFATKFPVETFNHLTANPGSYCMVSLLPGLLAAPSCQALRVLYLNARRTNVSLDAGIAPVQLPVQQYAEGTFSANSSASTILNSQHAIRTGNINCLTAATKSNLSLSFSDLLRANLVVINSQNNSALVDSADANNNNSAASSFLPCEGKSAIEQLLDLVFIPAIDSLIGPYCGGVRITSSSYSRLSATSAIPGGTAAEEANANTPAGSAFGKHVAIGFGGNLGMSAFRSVLDTLLEFYKVSEMKIKLINDALKHCVVLDSAEHSNNITSDEIFNARMEEVFAICGDCEGDISSAIQISSATPQTLMLALDAISAFRMRILLAVSWMSNCRVPRSLINKISFLATATKNLSSRDISILIKFLSYQLEVVNISTASNPQTANCSIGLQSLGALGNVMTSQMVYVIIPALESYFSVKGAMSSLSADLCILIELINNVFSNLGIPFVTASAHLTYVLSNALGDSLGMDTSLRSKLLSTSHDLMSHTMSFTPPSANNNNTSVEDASLMSTAGTQRNSSISQKLHMDAANYRTVTTLTSEMKSLSNNSNQHQQPPILPPGLIGHSTAIELTIEAEAVILSHCQLSVHSLLSTFGSDSSYNSNSSTSTNGSVYSSLTKRLMEILMHVNSEKLTLQVRNAIIRSAAANPEGTLLQISLMLENQLSLCERPADLISRRSKIDHLVSILFEVHKSSSSGFILSFMINRIPALIARMLRQSSDLYARALGVYYHASETICRTSVKVVDQTLQLLKAGQNSPSATAVNAALNQSTQSNASALASERERVASLEPIMRLTSLLAASIQVARVEELRIRNTQKNASTIISQLEASATRLAERRRKAAASASGGSKRAKVAPLSIACPSSFAVSSDNDVSVKIRSLYDPAGLPASSNDAESAIKFGGSQVVAACIRMGCDTILDWIISLSFGVSVCESADAYCCPTKPLMSRAFAELLAALSPMPSMSRLLRSLLSTFENVGARHTKLTETELGALENVHSVAAQIGQFVAQHYQQQQQQQQQNNASNQSGQQQQQQQPTLAQHQLQSQRVPHEASKAILEILQSRNRELSRISDTATQLALTVSAIASPNSFRTDSAEWYSVIRALLNTPGGLVNKPVSTGVGVLSVFNKVAPNIPLPCDPALIPQILQNEGGSTSALGPFWSILLDVYEGLSCARAKELTGANINKSESNDTSNATAAPEGTANTSKNEIQPVQPGVLLAVRFVSVLLNRKEWKLQNGSSVPGSSFMDLYRKPCYVFLTKFIGLCDSYSNAQVNLMQIQQQQPHSQSTPSNLQQASLAARQATTQAVAFFQKSCSARQVLAQRTGVSCVIGWQVENSFKQQQPMLVTDLPEMATRQLYRPTVITSILAVAESVNLLSVFVASIIPAKDLLSLLQLVNVLLKRLPILLENEPFAPWVMQQSIHSVCSLLVRAISGSNYVGWAPCNSPADLVSTRSFFWMECLKLKKKIMEGKDDASDDVEMDLSDNEDEDLEDNKNEDVEMKAEVDQIKKSEEAKEKKRKEKEMQKKIAKLNKRLIESLDKKYFSFLLPDNQEDNQPEILASSGFGDSLLSSSPLILGSLPISIPPLPIPSMTVRGSCIGDLPPKLESIFDSRLSVDDRSRIISQALKLLSSTVQLEYHIQLQSSSANIIGMAPPDLSVIDAKSLHALAKQSSPDTNVISSHSGAASLYTTVASHNTSILTFDTICFISMAFVEFIGPLTIPDDAVPSSATDSTDPRLPLLSHLRSSIVAGLAHPLHIVSTMCTHVLHHYFLPMALPLRLSALLDSRIWADASEAAVIQPPNTAGGLSSSIALAATARACETTAAALGLLLAAIPASTFMAAPPHVGTLPSIVPVIPGLNTDTAISNRATMMPAVSNSLSINESNAMQYYSTDLNSNSLGIQSAALNVLASFHNSVSSKSSFWGAPILFRDWLSSTASLRQESLAFATLSFAEMFALLWPHFGDVGRNLVLTRAVNLVVSESLVLKCRGGMSSHVHAYQNVPLRLCRAVFDAVLACKDPVADIPVVTLYSVAKSLGIGASLLQHLELKMTEVPLGGLAALMASERAMNAYQNSFNNSTNEDNDVDMDQDTGNDSTIKKEPSLLATNTKSSSSMLNLVMPTPEQIFDEAEETRLLHSAMSKTFSSLDQFDLATAVTRSRALTETLDEACALMLLGDNASAQDMLETSLRSITCLSATTLEEKSEAELVLSTWTTCAKELHQWRVLHVVGAQSVLGPLEVEIAAKASHAHIASLSLAHRMSSDMARPFLRAGASALLESAREVTAMPNIITNGRILPAAVDDSRVSSAIEEVLRAVYRDGSCSNIDLVTGNNLRNLFINCQRATELFEHHESLRSIRVSLAEVTADLTRFIHGHTSHQKKLIHAQQQGLASVPMDPQVAQIQDRALRTVAHLMNELRTRLTAWRTRLPGKWESFSVWSDLVQQRHCCFEAIDTIVSRYIRPLSATVHGLGQVSELANTSPLRVEAVPFLHDRLWTILRLANHARSSSANLPTQASILLHRLHREPLLASPAYVLDGPLFITETASLLATRKETAPLAFSVLQSSHVDRSLDSLAATCAIKKSSILLKTVLDVDRANSNLNADVRLRALLAASESTQRAQQLAPLNGKAWIHWGRITESLFILYQRYMEENGADSESSVPANLRIPVSLPANDIASPKEMAWSACSSYVLAASLLYEKPVCRLLPARALRLLTEASNEGTLSEETHSQTHYSLKTMHPAGWALFLHSIIRMSLQPSGTCPERGRLFEQILSRIVRHIPSQLLDVARLYRMEDQLSKHLSSSPHMTLPDSQQASLSCPRTIAHIKTARETTSTSINQFDSSLSSLWNLILVHSHPTKLLLSLPFMETLHDSLLAGLAPSKPELAFNIIEDIISAIGNLPDQLVLASDNKSAQHIMCLIAEALQNLETLQASTAAPKAAVIPSVSTLTFVPNSPVAPTPSPSSRALVLAVSSLLSHGLREDFSSLLTPNTSPTVRDVLATLTKWNSRIERVILSYSSPESPLLDSQPASGALAVFPLSNELSSMDFRGDMRISIDILNLQNSILIQQSNNNANNSNTSSGNNNNNTNANNTKQNISVSGTSPNAQAVPQWNLALLSGPSQLSRILPSVSLVRNGRRLVRRVHLLTNSGCTVPVSLNAQTRFEFDAYESMSELYGIINVALLADHAAKRKGIHLPLEGMHSTPLAPGWVLKETPPGVSMSHVWRNHQRAARMLLNLPSMQHDNATVSVAKSVYDPLLSFRKKSSKYNPDMNNKHDDDSSSTTIDSYADNSSSRRASLLLTASPSNLDAAEAFVHPSMVSQTINLQLAPAIASPFGMHDPTHHAGGLPRLLASMAIGDSAEVRFAAQSFMCRQLGAAAAINHILASELPSADEVFIRHGHTFASVKNVMPAFMKRALIGLLQSDLDSAKVTDTIAKTSFDVNLDDTQKEHRRQLRRQVKHCSNPAFTFDGNIVSHPKNMSILERGVLGVPRISANVQSLIGGNFALLGPFPASMATTAGALTGAGRKVLVTSASLLLFARTSAIAARDAHLKMELLRTESKYETLLQAEKMLLLERASVDLLRHFKNEKDDDIQIIQYPANVREARIESIEISRGWFARAAWIASLETQRQLHEPYPSILDAAPPSNIHSSDGDDWSIKYPEIVPTFLWPDYEEPKEMRIGLKGKEKEGKEKVLRYVEELIDFAMDQQFLSEQPASSATWI